MKGDLGLRTEGGDGESRSRAVFAAGSSTGLVIFVVALEGGGPEDLPTLFLSMTCLSASIIIGFGAAAVVVAESLAFSTFSESSCGVGSLEMNEPLDEGDSWVWGGSFE